MEPILRHLIISIPMRIVFTPILMLWETQPKLFNRIWIKIRWLITLKNKRVWIIQQSSQPPLLVTNRRRVRIRWSRDFFKSDSRVRLNLIKWALLAGKIWIIIILKMRFRRKNLNNQPLTTWLNLKAEKISMNWTPIKTSFTTTQSLSTATISTLANSTRASQSTKML